MDKLSSDNYLLYAAKHYDNPQCYSNEEFFEDLNRLKYIKKLLTRYKTSGELKDRLILNHLIVLNNVFGPVPLCRILYLKMKQYYDCLMPFLVLLNIMPETLYNIENESTIYLDTILMDMVIVERLRNI
jgi:hypothetical protein